MFYKREKSFFEYLSFKLWFWLLHLPVGSEGGSELSGEGGKEEAAAEAEVSPHSLNLPITGDFFELFCREEVLIVAVIKLKMGIKGVVRKETLAAENADSVAISSNLFSLTLHLTLQAPAFVFNLG